MKFLIDAQLPPGLAMWIRQQGAEADHVSHVGLLAASDASIAAYAEKVGSTLISKDADFVVLRLPNRVAFVWLRCGNATNRALQAWLSPRWEQIVMLISAGEGLVEVR